MSAGRRPAGRGVKREDVSIYDSEYRDVLVGLEQPLPKDEYRELDEYYLAPKVVYAAAPPNRCAFFFSIHLSTFAISSRFVSSAFTSFVCVCACSSGRVRKKTVRIRRYIDDFPEVAAKVDHFRAEGNHRAVLVYLRLVRAYCLACGGARGQVT